MKEGVLFALLSYTPRKNPAGDFSFYRELSTMKKPTVAIIESTYRPKITERLVATCTTTLKKEGIPQKNIFTFSVPGALEIPLLAKKLARQKKYDAIIVFGVVLKGKTYHFEQVANECVRGCMDVSYEYEVPVIFEVLCVYKLKDAVIRSVGKKDNRGEEGARTALAMSALYKKI